MSLQGSWRVTDAHCIRRIRRDMVGLVVATTNDADPSLAAPAQRVSTVLAELASNAVRHAPGRIMVDLYRGPGSWLLSVTDGRPDRAPQVRPTDPRRPGGLGLPMVGMLAADVGWDAHDDGKRVWARIDDTVPEPLVSRLLGRGGSSAGRFHSIQGLRCRNRIRPPPCVDNLDCQGCSRWPTRMVR